jgi:hypothetical protein
MQAPAPPGIAPPCLPGREEIHAGAEARLENDEALATRPALGDAISSHEDMARLRHAAAGAVVDIVELLRVRDTLLGEAQRRRDERGGHGLIVRR